MSIPSEVVGIKVYAKSRPDPADDPSNADDRLQAAQEIHSWMQWPWDLEVVIRLEDGETATEYYYGAEGKAHLRELLMLTGIL